MDFAVNIDSITHEIIPDEFLTKFIENNKEFMFDLRTLVKDYIYSGNLRNPFTRCELPEDVKKSIMKYIETYKIVVYYSYVNNSVIMKQVEMCNLHNVAHVLLEILHKETLLGYIGITNFEKEKESKDDTFEIFDNLNKNLDEVNLNQKKIIISEIKTLYDKYNVNVSWFRYFYDNNDKLVELIDYKFHIRESNLNIQINHEVYHALLDIIKIVMKIKKEVLEESNFVLFLNELFKSHRISSEHARSLIQILGKDKRIKKLNQFILSIVADKYNLDKHDKLEGLYALPKKVGDIIPIYNENTLRSIFTALLNDDTDLEIISTVSIL